MLGGGNHLMVVKVNPRDVVSIPSDYNNAKGRACEYLIYDEIVNTDLRLRSHYSPNDESSVSDSIEDEPVTADSFDTLADKAIKSFKTTATAADRKVTAAATKAKVTGIKLSYGDIAKIRKMLTQGFKYDVIGMEFGVHRRTIERIDKGIAWANIPHVSPKKKVSVKKKTSPKKKVSPKKKASKVKAKKKR
jgi:uncharacterized protein YerC